VDRWALKRHRRTVGKTGGGNGGATTMGDDAGRLPCARRARDRTARHLQSLIELADEADDIGATFGPELAGMFVEHLTEARD
jgi:hypothetical protein